MRLLAGVDSPTDDPFAKTVTLDMDGTWQSRGQAAGNRGLAGSGNACYEPRVVGWTAHRGDEAMGIRGTKSCSRSPVTFRCGRLGRVQDRSAFKRPTSYGGALRACVEGRLSAARHVSRLRARQAATAQFLEDRLGQVSAYAHSISVGQDGARSSQGRSERPVPLLVAQDVLQLPAEHVLVFHRDQPPARAERADGAPSAGCGLGKDCPQHPYRRCPPARAYPTSATTTARTDSWSWTLTTSEYRCNQHGQQERCACTAGPQLETERRVVATFPVKPAGSLVASRWEPTPGFPSALGPSHQAATSHAGDGGPFAATGCELLRVAAAGGEPRRERRGLDAHRKDQPGNGSWIRPGSGAAAGVCQVVPAGGVRPIHGGHQLG